MKSLKGIITGGRRATLFLLCFALLLGAMPNSAAAGEFTLRPCDAYSVNAFWMNVFDAGATMRDHCPFELKLEHVSASPPGSVSWWEYGETQAEVSSATIAVTGSDGSDSGRTQGFALCDLNGECGSIVSPSGPAVDEPEVLQVSALDTGAPPDADRLVTKSECGDGAEECPIGRGVEIKSLAITYEDETPPTAQFEISNPDATPSASGVTWYKNPLHYSWTAEDEESGVLSGTFKTAWVTAGSVSGECDLGGWMAHFCGPMVFEQAKTADISKLRQGENAIVLQVVNGASMVTEQRSTFFVDTLPPGSPEDASVAGASATGWVSSNSIDLQWTNPGDAAEGWGDASGIAKAHLRILSNDDRGYVLEDRFIPVEITRAMRVNGIAMPDRDGIWLIQLSMVDHAGNEGAPVDMRVKVDPSSPEVTVYPIPPIITANFEEEKISWMGFKFGRSGICRYAVSATPYANSDPGAGQFVSDVYSLPASQLLSEKTRYVHVRAVSCAGVLGPVTHVPVSVDLTPPTVTAMPQTANWRPAPADLDILADDRQGAASVSYALDGGTPVATGRQNVRLALDTGEHTIRYQAADAAGNRSSWQESTARVDGEPPTALLSPSDPKNPTRLSAAVADRHSGVQTAWLEYQKIGESSSWTPLPGRVNSSIGEKALTVFSTIPDDGSLVAGVYRVRVAVVDMVGNTTVTSARVDGLESTFTSPVRSLSTITSGVKAGRAAGSRAVAEMNQIAEIAGKLTSADGSALSGAELNVFAAAPDGGDFVRIGTCRTLADGSYRYFVPPGPSRVLDVRFDGDYVNGPSVSRTTLRVRGKITLRASRQVISRRRQVVLRGRVATGGVPLPVAGKEVRVQFHNGHRWSAFEHTAHTDSDGAFAATLTLNNVARYRLRASAPPEPGWPFEPAYSRSVTVRVRR